MTERVICEYCLASTGTSVSFSHRQGLYRHRKANHPESFAETRSVAAPCAPARKTKITVSARLGEVDQLRSALVQEREKSREKDQTINQVLETVKQLQDKIEHIQPPTQNITQINNNINIYFNKDLKYYPELVKLLGRKNTCDYLLFKMPESRDLFGVLDKLFVRDGISYCPIRVGDDDEFIVARNNDEYIHDPTGELIDRENKSKLQDAVLSAYIDSTRHLDDECEKLRRDRVNGEYSEHDMETINKRFDSAIEPSRPYEVIDIMNGIKPKKKDFDRLRRMCPKVVKKIVV